MRTILLVAMLLATLGAVVHAEVIELEGTIKSIDAEKREITIGKKTLDVAKKCQIVIEGEEANLADLKVDQKVLVEFDDDVDVAKTIAVGVTGAGIDAMVKDLKGLQGEWVATTLVISGTKLKKSEMQRHSRRFVIEGNSYTEEVVRDGNLFTIKGKFEIDPRTKTFDFIGRGQFAGKEPNQNVKEIFGFYSITGDTVTLVLRSKENSNTSRPSKFGEGDEGKAWTNSFVLERDE